MVADCRCAFSFRVEMVGRRELSTRPAISTCRSSADLSVLFDADRSAQTCGRTRRYLPGVGSTAGRRRDKPSADARNRARWWLRAPPFQRRGTLAQVRYLDPRSIVSQSVSFFRDSSARPLLTAAVPSMRERIARQLPYDERRSLRREPILPGLRCVQRQCQHA
jgi:hypothetical protein